MVVGSNSLPLEPESERLCIMDERVFMACTVLYTAEVSAPITHPMEATLESGERDRMYELQEQREKREGARGRRKKVSE